MYFLAQLNVYAVIIGLVIAIIFFVQAVIRQQKYDKLVRKSEHLIWINENEISTIETFDNGYYDGEKFEQPHHLYTDDLDIFGANSMYSLINRAKTFNGIHYLSQLFLTLPTKKEIADRQSAILELEQKLDWRQDFANTLFEFVNGEKRDFAKEIDAELQLELNFVQGKVLNLYRKALPIIWLAVATLYFINIDIANIFASVFFMFNLVLTFRKVKETTHVQGRLSNASIMLRSYGDALDTIFSEQWTSPLLKTQVEKFKVSAEKDSSTKVLKQLQQIIEQLDYRLNFIPAIILNGMFLWDFRVLYKLVGWKEEHAGKLNELFEFVGEMEAFSGLANWSYNHPHYTMPTIEEEYFSLAAIDIKHPLIPSEENVGNDFSIQKGEYLNIVTGSNMSGKSTLLRTLGINMILGYTGTRVAAKSLSFPIVKLISYMRIKDILEESVSTFKAELNRIKMILDILKTDAQCFILIDEMLRGTNSRDKLIGSIGIAKRLLAEKTYSMIATHDIKLAELGLEIPEGIANYYFDIDYADGELVFDYKVKQGICENFNASFLLSQLGIDMGEE
ncbi:DNA mismatch repair protein MutS [Portibacter lacus]|uniref:DNA mismatch repair protein MutS n=2 Tax=Portibacter lacus TaxID=1099794 RepID=A0AA37SNI9_9BACT|nr:DNA mismatch repair protein MutS [Portibacter lacus]